MLNSNQRKQVPQTCALPLGQLSHLNKSTFLFCKVFGAEMRNNLLYVLFNLSGKRESNPRMPSEWKSDVRLQLHHSLKCP